jgi:hypothetical protein
MAIYSQTVQDLTNEIVAQAAELQRAIGINDTTAIATAADAIEQAATSLDQEIKSADVPADNTMILEFTTQLLGQVQQLQQAITATDDAAIAVAADAITQTATNLDQCVKVMSETQPLTEPGAPPPVNTMI